MRTVKFFLEASFRWGGEGARRWELFVGLNMLKNKFNTVMWLELGGMMGWRAKHNEAHFLRAIKGHSY